MSDALTSRWIDGPALSADEWTAQTERIARILEVRGWMPLNQQTSRIRVKEDADGNLRGFFVFQFLPYCGPMYVAPSERGTGLADDLADEMQSFLQEAHARGYVIIADNPVAAKMCEARDMTKIESPVYVKVGG